MIKSILSIFLLFLILEISGQDVTGNLPVQYERGYVYLKNGSVLKGKYLYSSSMDKLRLISGKNSWIFDMSEIDKVSKLRPFQPAGESPMAAGGELPDFNWFNITELGVLPGNNDNSQSAPLIMSSSINRQFLKNWSAGLGAGIEFYKETYLPLTANNMYKFRNTRVTPQVTLQAGYQIPIEDSRTIYYDVVPDFISSRVVWPNTQTEMKAKGGLLLNPSAGLLIQSWHGVGLSFSMGYRFHRLHYTAKDDYRLDIDYNRLSLKLGIIIN